ncbi:MAG: hypothetical protein ACI81C_002771 [Alteromonas macleodii]|jgi:hypothetical protein
MGLVKNLWRGFAGGADLNRQQTLRFILEDIQVQVRLPYSNVDSEQPPRLVNYSYKTPGWFESNMHQQRQHYYVHLQSRCWFYLFPLLRFGDGEQGHLFCSLWLKRVPADVNALDRQQLVDYVIEEHNEHYNADYEPDTPYSHGKGINTEIRLKTRAEAELAASRGSPHRLENLEKYTAIAIENHGFPSLTPASIIQLHGQHWVYYQDKRRQDSPDGEDFYCLPLDSRYYFAISFQLYAPSYGNKRWLKHAKATQQMVLDSLKVSPADNTADNLLVHTNDK